MRNDQTVQEKLRVETKIASVWIATAWLVRRFKRNWDQNRKRMNFQQPDWSKGTRKTNHIRHLAKEDQNEWMTHKQKEKKTISRIFLIFKNFEISYNHFLTLFDCEKIIAGCFFQRPGQSLGRSQLSRFLCSFGFAVFMALDTQNVWIWSFKDIMPSILIVINYST